MNQHYCFQCGTVLEVRHMDHREREVCPACGWVYYPQLKVGAAVIIEAENKLLLLQRNHEPWKGSWMLPAGYVEADEDPMDAARREVFEELGLTVEIKGLYKTWYATNDPRGKIVSFFYFAEIVSGEMHLNEEIRAAEYFSWRDIPSYLTKSAHDLVIAEWQAAAKQKESRS